MASWFNLSGTLSAFRLLRDPTLCLPQHAVSSFNHLPIPLSNGIRSGEEPADIRAVVLDKDNCFAIPHENEVFTLYKVSDYAIPLSQVSIQGLTEHRIISKNSEKHIQDQDF